MLPILQLARLCIAHPVSILLLAVPKVCMPAYIHLPATLSHVPQALS